MAGSGTLVVASATGLPATGTFRLRLGNIAGTIVRVDSRVGTTLTVTVEQDDGNANVGDTVTLVVTAGGLLQLKADAIAGAGGGLPWLPSLAALDQSGWAWTNQGGASIVQANGIVLFTVPSAVGENLRLRTVAVPATPYTFTALLIPNPMFELSFQNFGLCLRESGTGKLISIHLEGLTTNTIMRIRKNTNPTTISSSFATSPLIVPPFLFLRVGADGTNVTFEYGFDGRNFAMLLSEAKATFFTTAPDEVGLSAQNFNSGIDARCSYVSWVQG